MCDHSKNIYKPHLATIEQIVDETPDVRTFRLVFQDEAVRNSFTFRSGQFAEYSAFGSGESTFCIASSPTRTGHIECCFRAVGKVTEALRRLEVGDSVGVRGPYGNSFPIEDFYGKNLVFVAGGIALPPLRTLIWNALDQRDRFGDITIIYGARTEADLVYKRELKEWQERSDVRLVKTVDPGGNSPEWDGRVGFVPTILEEAAPAAANTIALVCGPPIMNLHHPGEPDEVRPGQMRPLQRGQCLCLQGWPGVYRRPGEGDVAGVLMELQCQVKDLRSASAVHTVSD
ncbi:MAG: hdrF [Deltaproteobacteria bacterium]|nr:hdrF [Deltaproteobacteria bacterium]